MSTLPPNNQDDGLGKGKREKKPTAKARANAKATSRQAASQASLSTHPPTQSQAPAQPQNAAPTDRCQTRSQARNQNTSTAQINPALNCAAQGQSTGSGPSSQLAPRRSPKKTSKAKIHGLMIKIYEEIHRVATVKHKKDDLYDVHLFLFNARVCRFFKLLPANDSETLKGLLQAYPFHNPRAGQVVDDAKRALQFSEQDRLSEFCAAPNLLLLTICAHSNSFRDVIQRSDAESRQLGEPLWSDIYPVIKTCTSSLELFARSYDFAWLDSLRKFEQHFSTVLESVYPEQREKRGLLQDTDKSNFGIAPGDLNEIHRIPAGQEFHIYHHWCLPIEDKQPAIRPTIVYTVTPDMARAPFVNDFNAIIDRPRKGKRVKPQPPVHLPVGSRQNLQQLDITKSVLLGGQPWPVGADQNVIGEPTFCGAPGNPCVACGAVAPAVGNGEVDDSDDDILVVSSEGNTEAIEAKSAPEDSERPPGPKYPCNCTTKELMTLGNANKPPFNNSADILVELYTTKDKGRGVRSLQRIPKDTFVGNYVGEIYPEVDIGAAPGTDNEMNRYGRPEGCVYHYSVAAGPTAHPDPLPANHPHFTIDSAHLGSWTRYMNHSCGNNATFAVVNLGQRWTTVCKTVKTIQFGEEVTVNYGKQYFELRGLDCRCGHAKCSLKDVSKKGKKRTRDEVDSEDEQDGDRVSSKKTVKARKVTAKAASKATKGKSKSKAGQKGARRRR